MMHTQIITHFTDDDLYKFTMCYAIMMRYPRAQVRYTFTDRNNTKYPIGFADLCNEQVKMMESLRLTDEEAEFFMRRCGHYLPYSFILFLKGFRYSSKNVNFTQDEEGHLSLTYEGNWFEYVLYEVKLLAIISELWHSINGDCDKVSLPDYYDITYNKATKMFTNGLSVAEFGTRRRLSYDVQNVAVKAMKRAFIDCGEQGKFLGTSNVYLAMANDLTPIGTHAHEWVASIAGFFGPQEANSIAMEEWQKAYGGNLGIYLYDTFTFEPFKRNFSKHYARVYDGLRVDSGDNDEQRDKICELYRSLGVDPTTKTVMFSNALTTDEAIALNERSKGKCKVGFGIGTHITCDGEQWGIPHANIVIKVVASRLNEKLPWNDTCKMSEDKGKFCGNEKCYETYKYLLHLS